VTRDKKRWRDFTPLQQRAIVVAAAAELVTTTAALVDLKRRSRSQVRGPKLLWVLAFVVQPFGPLAYFSFGRRR
jgi:hypothetical protein